MMKGIFYGTGIGPGDPELVTIKARIAIEKCPVIVLPNPDRKDCIAYKTAEKLGIDLKNKIIVETDFQTYHPAISHSGDVGLVLVQHQEKHCRLALLACVQHTL